MLHQPLQLCTYKYLQCVVIRKLGHLFGPLIYCLWIGTTTFLLNLNTKQIYRIVTIQKTTLQSSPCAQKVGKATQKKIQSLNHYSTQIAERNLYKDLRSAATLMIGKINYLLLYIISSLLRPAKYSAFRSVLELKKGEAMNGRVLILLQ